MQEDEIQEISKEISRLGEINPDTADTILEDFYRLSLAQTFLARGGLNSPRNSWSRLLEPNPLKAAGLS